MTEALPDRLVEVALKLLEDEGPKALTQPRVAKAAGLKPGHLTYYFPKRADLVAAVLDRFAEKGRAPLRRWMEQVGERERADVEAMSLRQIRSLVVDGKRSRALIGFMVEGFDDPELMKTLSERVEVNRLLMGAYLGLPAESEEVELAVATLQGLALNHLLSPYSGKRVDALIARFRKWAALFTGSDT